jgi:hypothetical protein
MPVCKSCKANVPLSQRDMASGYCFECLAAKKRGLSLEEYRAQKHAAQNRSHRAWLEAAFRYYATTDDWPAPERNALGQFIIPNDSFSRFILTLGQIVSVIAGALSAIGMVGSLVMAGTLQTIFPGVGSGAVALEAFLFSAAAVVFWLAMFFVFGRVKWITRLVECQQMMLARVLERLEGVKPPSGAPAGEANKAQPDELVSAPVGELKPVTSGEVVLAVVESRTLLGGWVVLECATGEWLVPRLRGGELVEIRRADGSTLTAIVEGEESHVRDQRPGRVAFSLRSPSMRLAVKLEEVANAVEVKIVF